jgi:hypothetical protein
MSLCMRTAISLVSVVIYTFPRLSAIGYRYGIPASAEMSFQAQLTYHKRGTRGSAAVFQGL